MLRAIIIGTLLCCLWASSAPAAEPVVVQSVSGKTVDIPAKGRVTLLAYVRTGQTQSRSVLSEINSVAGDADVIVILSGTVANDAVDEVSQHGRNTWPVVIDPQFALSGRWNVHVWPTTVVIGADGQQLAHLAGASPTLKGDLKAYLEFAAGKIDEAALKQRLGKSDVVADSARQAAGRRLEVARRLLESGRLDEARRQLEEGLKLSPGDPGLTLLLARVQMLQNDPSGAVKTLDAIAPGAPAWQVNVLKGRAAIMLEQWEDARQLLTDAVRLSPSPAEAHYLLGVVWEHDRDWPRAAAAYRKAIEAEQPAWRIDLPE